MTTHKAMWSTNHELTVSANHADAISDDRVTLYCQHGPFTFCFPQKVADARTLAGDILAKANELEGIKAESDELQQLLRTPFEIEMEMAPAVTNAEPDFCHEAEYTTVIVDESIVYKAVDWLMDKYMKELEGKLEELMKAEKRNEA